MTPNKMNFHFFCLALSWHFPHDLCEGKKVFLSNIERPTMDHRHSISKYMITSNIASESTWTMYRLTAQSSHLSFAQDNPQIVLIQTLHITCTCYHHSSSMLYLMHEYKVGFLRVSHEQCWCRWGLQTHNYIYMYMYMYVVFYWGNISLIFSLGLVDTVSIFIPTICTSCNGFFTWHLFGFFASGSRPHGKAKMI